jgi:hypothetical protein
MNTQILDSTRMPKWRGVRPAGIVENFRASHHPVVAMPNEVSRLLLDLVSGG